jgi:hypothetical protein
VAAVEALLAVVDALVPDVFVPDVFVPDVLVLAAAVLEPESLDEPPQPANRAVAARIATSPLSPSIFPVSTIARLAFRLKFPEHSGDSHRTRESGMTVTKQSCDCLFAGNPAVSPIDSDRRPEALRPRLAAGLPLTRERSEHG